MTVLYCDTVDQVKMKILSRLYSDTPYSTRMSMNSTTEDYELEYHDPGTSELNHRVRKMRNIDADRYLLHLLN